MDASQGTPGSAPRPTLDAPCSLFDRHCAPSSQLPLRTQPPPPYHHRRAPARALFSCTRAHPLVPHILPHPRWPLRLVSSRLHSSIVGPIQPSSEPKNNPEAKTIHHHLQPRPRRVPRPPSFPVAVPVAVVAAFCFAVTALLPSPRRQKDSLDPSSLKRR